MQPDRIPDQSQHPDVTKETAEKVGDGDGDGEGGGDDGDGDDGGGDDGDNDKPTVSGSSSSKCEKSKWTFYHKGKFPSYT